MTATVLYEQGSSKAILLDEGDDGDLAVQANQHLIVHNNESMILDPGGHKVYSKVLSDTLNFSRGTSLKYLFLSHQDPDIVAAINGWLMTTDAEAWVSSLWVRFVPHFGVDRLVIDRLKPIPDEGMYLTLGGVDLAVLPAHFLHSAGNFQIYDPVTKILYTGDLGAALGMPYMEVPDFDNHLQYMEGFHRRYMSSSRAMSLWASMARGLDIDMIAPQHGAVFKGKEMVNKFINWADGFECGIELMDSLFQMPPKP